MWRSFLLFLAVVAVAWAQLPMDGWNTDTSRKSINLKELLAGGPPKDGIPSIDKPKFVTVQEAREWLDPKELVLVYGPEEDTRAYPLEILIFHELVNDHVAGAPVLVSYCPLCNSAIVFDRRVVGEALEFGVSGMLRYSDMVMYDRKTESLWQQITGEAIVGTYTGKKLEMLAALTIPFDEFAQAHPKGKVLSRETGHRRPYGSNPYRGYGFGKGPIMPVPDASRKGIKPMDRLVVIEGAKQAYLFQALAKRGVWHDEVNGQDLVLFYEPSALSPVDSSDMKRSRKAGSAAVFQALLDGKPIRFRYEDGKILDKETGSRWNIAGIAEEGPLKGKKLKAVPHGVYFSFAWLAFEPNTKIAGLR